MLNMAVYQEIEAVVGADNITCDEQICDSYAVQAFHRPDFDKWIFRPIAVVLPGCTEEVAAFVKIANKYNLKYKAHSTGFGAHAGAGADDVVIVDLRRMNRMIEIDEKNMYAVVEPYCSSGEIQQTAWRHGLSVLMTTAGPQSSSLASVTSHQGGGASSVSMGYNGRNLLACEWVTPTGEIVRVGSNEGEAGWFSADGPGPSMKGIVRGYFGYDGAFGIFTKAAIKLYHWAGPKEIVNHNDGHMYDSDIEVPENVHYYNLFCPDWESVSAAMYALTQCEVANFMYKLAPFCFYWGYAPSFMEEVTSRPIVREAARSLQHCITIVVIGNTKNDLDYKVSCLKKVSEDIKGILLGGHPESQFTRSLTATLFMATGFLIAFNGHGSFHAAMGADESHDICIKQGYYAEQIKENIITEGKTVDDLGDVAFVCPYDQFTWGHCEGVMLIDTEKEEYASSMLRYSMECADIQFDERLGGIGFSCFGGKQVVDKFSAATRNYFDEVMKIKGIWDPDNLANMTFV